MATSTKTQRKRINEDKQKELNEYKLKAFLPKNHKQKYLFQSCKTSPLTLGLGPAGTGKSYVGAYAACQMLIEGTVDKIILTRNPLPTGSSVGFFAGSEDEKMAVWLGPIIGTIKKILNQYSGNDGYFKYLCANEEIQAIPMEVMKGYSFDDAFIIVEEAQECDIEQLKNLTTRTGENSYIFLNGDTKQKNSKLKGQGFSEFVDIIKSENEYSRTHASEDWDKIQIPVVEFNSSECVRSPITKKLIHMFERYDI